MQTGGACQLFCFPSAVAAARMGMGSRTIFHFKDGSFSEETVGGIYFPWLRKKLSPTILQA